MVDRVENEHLAAIVVGIEGILSILETHTEILTAIKTDQTEMFEWLRQPPSSDLPDLLRRLAEAIEQNTAILAEQNAKIEDLPAAVARAVVDGEIGPHG